MPEDGELVADCRLRAAADLFAHTWDPVVLAALGAGARRRAQLRAEIGGIRDKPLTDALRRLTETNLVTRTQRNDAWVEYALSPLGRSLYDGPIRALADWAVHHAADLLG